MIAQAGENSWSELLTDIWLEMRAILHRIGRLDMSLWPGEYRLLLFTAINGGFGKSGTSPMDSIGHRFLVRAQTVLASVTDLLRKFLGMNGKDFASQRMCPFCGLITSRRKTCCLECGKTLKPA
jgi:hypothetical protein